MRDIICSSNKTDASCLKLAKIVRRRPFSVSEKCQLDSIEDFTSGDKFLDTKKLNSNDIRD